jgi:hypothetical protein
MCKHRPEAVAVDLTEKTRVSSGISAWAAFGQERILTAAAKKSACVCHNYQLQLDLYRADGRPAAISTVYSRAAGLDIF